MNYQLDCVNLVYDAEKDGGTAALRDVTLSIDGKGLIGIQGTVWKRQKLALVHDGRT